MVASGGRDSCQITPQTISSLDSGRPAVTPGIGQPELDFFDEATRRLRVRVVLVPQEGIDAGLRRHVIRVSRSCRDKAIRRTRVFREDTREVAERVTGVPLMALGWGAGVDVAHEDRQQVADSRRLGFKPENADGGGDATGGGVREKEIVWNRMESRENETSDDALNTAYDPLGVLEELRGKAQNGEKINVAE